MYPFISCNMYFIIAYAHRKVKAMCRKDGRRNVPQRWQAHLGRFFSENRLPTPQVTCRMPFHPIKTNKSQSRFLCTIYGEIVNTPQKQEIFTETD